MDENERNEQTQQNDYSADLRAGADTDTFVQTENEQTTAGASGLNTETFGQSTAGQYDAYSTSYETAQPAQGYVGSSTAVPPKESKALEICALVFSILSLCGCCWGLFALVGLILSIVALAKGKKNGISIAALICSILGILVAVLSVVWLFTPTGKEFRDDIVKSVEVETTEDYAGAYEEDADADEEDTEEEDTKNNAELSDKKGTGTKEIQESEMGTSMVNGAKVTVPCSVENFLKTVGCEVDADEVDEIGELDTYASDYLRLYVDGEATNTYMYVENTSEDTLEDVEQMTVTGIWQYDNGNKALDCTLYAGVKLGMDEKEFLSLFKEEDVSCTENDSTYYYTVEKGSYQMDVIAKDGEVTEIEISYY